MRPIYPSNSGRRSEYRSATFLSPYRNKRKNKKVANRYESKMSAQNGLKTSNCLILVCGKVVPTTDPNYFLRNKPIMILPKKKLPKLLLLSNSFSGISSLVFSVIFRFLLPFSIFSTILSISTLKIAKSVRNETKVVVTSKNCFNIKIRFQYYLTKPNCNLFNILLFKKN